MCTNYGVVLSKEVYMFWEKSNGTKNSSDFYFKLDNCLILNLGFRNLYLIRKLIEKKKLPLATFAIFV